MKKKWQPPKWVKSIKEGSHGSTSCQKRLWKLVSDYTRIRDYYKYGTCISCSKRFSSWQDSQAGHWRAYTLCYGYSKFMCLDNINAQCPMCNKHSDGPIGEMMSIEMRKRGINTDKIIEDIRNKGEKLEDIIMVQHMEKILGLMADLPEKPEYYQRTVDNLVDLNV